MPDSPTQPAASTEAPLPAGLAVGEKVMSWEHDMEIRYGGPSDAYAYAVLTDRATGEPVLYCPPQHVAPVGTPIPVKDERVVIEKRPTWERPYGEVGVWRLTLPSGEPSWHRTKREAIAHGHRRLAILDWHADRPSVLPHTGITVPHARLTVRSLNELATSRGEAYTGELVLNGNLIGTIENTGTGGPTTWLPTDLETFAWADMLLFVAGCRDERGESMEEEFVLAFLFEEARTARDVRRWQREGLLPVRTIQAIVDNEDEIVDTFADVYYGIPGAWLTRRDRLPAEMWRQFPTAHAIEIWHAHRWQPLPRPDADQDVIR
ncbi:hypothetical protein [Polymorphospora sp. NPDC050346]|uniref:hypothetical protein n=1 Tax=Polymorphospora sp. NPDC050346 TaxID=3155780 RepID=UPI0033CADB6B